MPVLILTALVSHVVSGIDGEPSARRILARAGRFADAFPSSVVVTLTETMLSKSIIDATLPVRDLLSRSGIHDFADQGQGESGRRYKPALLIAVDDGVIRSTATKVSLYRPETKDGDPRFWLYKLKKVARPGDSVALGVATDRRVVAVNLSSAATEAAWDAVEEAFAPLGPGSDTIQNLPLDRLMAKLEEIASSGPLPAVCAGDTAVGRTMETALGIEMNSSPLPDWEEKIELKFGRNRPSQRKNLFSLRSDKKLSVLSSAREILENFGYWRDGVLRLYVTVNAKPNAQGLFLYVDTAGRQVQVREGSTRPELPEVATWPLKALEAKLLEKHPETCWIVCAETKSRGIIHFQPTEVLYTHSPRVDLIPLLVSTGQMSLDHLIKAVDNSVRDKGTAWKVTAAGRSDLFSEAKALKLLP
jgi:hypothetical protein